MSEAGSEGLVGRWNDHGGAVAARGLLGEVRRGGSSLRDGLARDGFEIEGPSPVRGRYRGKDAPSVDAEVRGFSRGGRAAADTVRATESSRIHARLPKAFGAAYARDGFMLVNPNKDAANAANHERQLEQMRSSSDEDLVRVGKRNQEVVEAMNLKEIRMRTDFMLDSNPKIMASYKREYPQFSEDQTRQAVARRLFEKNLDFNRERNGSGNNVRDMIASWAKRPVSEVPGLPERDRGLVKAITRGLSAITGEVARREMETGQSLGFTVGARKPNIVAREDLAGLDFESGPPSAVSPSPSRGSRVRREDGLGI